mgnify:CR=1 FL=1
MHRALQNHFNRRPKPARKWLVAGTDISYGSRDLNHMYVWAVDEETAWAQALDRAAGTSFTPEAIELALLPGSAQ